MRTTLTLDPDVAAMLERVREATGLGLKEAVNEAMRRGLAQLEKGHAARKPFRTRTLDLGESLVPFVRLVTNRRIFGRAVSLGEAWRTVEGWLASEVAFVPVPTPRHAEILGDLLATRGLGSKDVPDAHLAALAIEHGLTLCSVDAGFARFAGLRWDN